jgi:anti-sigma factor RsiW
VTCREFTEFIMDYLSGELESSRRTLFERHLEECINCRRYLKSYEASSALGKHAFDHADAAVPADVPETLIQAILSAKRQS